jgi:uncharacterized protein with PIN domain
MAKDTSISIRVDYELLFAKLERLLGFSGRTSNVVADDMERIIQEVEDDIVYSKGSDALMRKEKGE